MPCHLNPRHLDEWRDAHPTLVRIVREILGLWYWPMPFIVTSIARTHAEDLALGASGIHSSGPPWRALDFRISHLGPHHQEQADAIAKTINLRWAYDPARPSKLVLFTAPHGTGPHGHVQVHAATILREKIPQRV